MIPFQADLLIDCCGFGRVVRLICVDSLGGDIDKTKLGVGSAAVTFQDVSAAQACVDKLNGKMFDNSKVEAILLFPNKNMAPQLQEELTNIPCVLDDGQDVDDFFNSLL